MPQLGGLVEWSRRPARLWAAARCTEGHPFVTERSREITQCFQYGVARPLTPGQRGIMAIMPDLTRRAVLRMGVGASARSRRRVGVERPAGSARAASRATATGSRPVRAADGGQQPADQAHRIVRLGGPRRRQDQLGDRHAARPDRVAASGDRTARQGRRREPDARLRCRGGAGPTGQRRASRRSRWWASTAAATPTGTSGPPATDSGAMVLEELLPMLSSMGFDTSRVGFMGWSMGGYGALHLGAKLGPSRTAGICAISPALFTSFTGSTPGAFDSYDDWVQNSVLGVPALSEIPLRVDCGTVDRFYFATRQFVNQLKTPPAGSFSKAGTTSTIGARSCPASWPGWRPSRCDDSPAGRYLRPAPSSGAARRSGPGFRPDIEGLRAVAVIAVVLYHAGIPGVTGGYIGVDVFFVISGFLITGLLWREVDHHQYRSAGPLLRCTGPPPAAGRGHRRHRHRDRWRPSCCRRCRREASSSTASPVRCMSATTGSPRRAPTT